MLLPRKNRLPFFGALFLVALTVGCGGPITFTQRLVGDWVGRPETSAERIDREWPDAGLGQDAPSTKPEELPETIPTVIESLAGMKVMMRLTAAGGAALSLDDAQPLEGAWRLVTAEGRRGVIEIEINGDEEAGLSGERRRFQVVFVPPKSGEPERFTLAEQGADPQFGRLLFERAGNGATLTRSEP